MVNKLRRWLYRNYLRLRWNMSSSNSALLAGAFEDDWRRKQLLPYQILSIHRKGFCVIDWLCLGLNDETCKNYFRNVDYYRLHPVNGPYSKWIDDKLTLKYLCSGTKLDQYLPKYYFQIDKKGRICSLMDLPVYIENPCAKDIASLLREKGTLAIKLVAGSIGAGFYKGEYVDDTYYLNGKAYDLTGFCSQIEKLRDYLIIEYLRPHPDVAQFCPDTANCFRYLVGRMDDGYQRIKAYIRFGTRASGFVENYSAGGVLCFLDENGHFVEGNIIDPKTGHNQVLACHPDTGKN